MVSKSLTSLVPELYVLDSNSDKLCGIKGVPLDDKDLVLVTPSTETSSWARWLKTMASALKLAHVYLSCKITCRCNKHFSKCKEQQKYGFYTLYYHAKFTCQVKICY